MKIHLAFLLLLTAFLPSLSGQNAGKQPAAADTVLMSEVVVTAGRAPARRFHTPASLTVVDRQQRQLGTARSAPEALFHVPGIFLQKTNHGGGSPFVRGLTGNQALLMIDGIRLSNATFRFGPNQYFNTLDPFTLQRIEVLRGGGSVAYGSDAIGGVIQALSRSAEFAAVPSWHGAVTGRVATSAQEFSERGEVQYNGKKLAFIGGLTRRDFGDLVGGENTGHQTPSGYDELNFDAKLRLALRENTILTLAHQNVHQTNVPVYHKVQLEDFAFNSMHPQRRQLTWMRLEHRRDDRSLLHHLEATFSWQQTEEGRTSLKLPGTTLRNENDRVRSLGAHLQARMRFTERWSAVNGVEAYSDFVGSSRYDITTATGSVTAKRGLYPDRSEMFSLAAYTLHRYEFFKGHAELGARYNTFTIRIPDRELGDVELSPSALVWNAALLRTFGRTALYANYNTAFRAPNIDDLGTLGIVDFRYEVPNFSLKPERSANLELGVRWRNTTTLLEAAVFRNRITDFIVRTIVPGDTLQGYPVYRKENAGESVIYGVEWAAERQLGDRWRLEGNMTYTYGQNISANEPVRRIPPLFGRLALQYNRQRWNAELEWLAAARQSRLAAGDRSDNRIPAGGTPGWEIVNLHLGLKAGKFLFQLSGVNLLNADYRTHGSGINGAGRSAWLQVQFAI